MVRYVRLLSVLSLFVLSGCAFRSVKILDERREFLGDPSTGGYTYEGEPVGGRHYLFLSKNDASFGDFLLSVIPGTDRADVVVAALTYFAYTKPDRSKFEEVVAKTNKCLLEREVSCGNTDLLWVSSLAEWIGKLRKEKAWADQSLEPTALLSPG